MKRWCVERDGVRYGARADDAGQVGGGAGYRGALTDGDWRVGDVEGLLDALAGARAGQVVFIAPDAVIDLTEYVHADERVLRVPGGVTIASDRGVDGSPGGMIVSDALQTRMIEAAGADVRVTGLRLRGPDPKRRLRFHYDCYGSAEGEGAERFYRLPNSVGVWSSHERLRVDNCEVGGFSHCGIRLHGGVGHALHHNFIHHCQRMGLGYGVTMSGAAEAVIHHNLLQDNKHSLAATGEPGQGYEAHDNVVLPATEAHPHPVTGLPYGQDHLFDMHGGRDREDGTNVAGRYLHAHHNTFLSPYTPVVIRGVPEDEATVRFNLFAAHEVVDGCVVSDGRTVSESNLACRLGEG